MRRRVFCLLVIIPLVACTGPVPALTLASSPTPGPTARGLVLQRTQTPAAATPVPPTMTPTLTPTPTATTAHTPVPTYVVVRGDTLGKIARLFGSTIESIASANAITNMSLIEVGQVLVLPEKAKTPDASIPTHTQLPAVKPSSTPAAAASAVVTATPKAPIPPTSPVSPGMAGPASRLEWVMLEKVLDCDTVVIVRKNGEVWILQRGIGCLSLDSFEGRSIVVYSPGLFAGVGSSVILPGRNQECRIWDSERLGGTTGGSELSSENGLSMPPAEVVHTCIDGEFEGWQGDTIFKLCNGHIWQQASWAWHWHWAYRPEVVIVHTSGGYKMVVEGVEGSIYVKRLK